MIKKTSGANAIVRKVTILIIVLFLLLPLIPSYQISRRVAQLYLNYRTRDYMVLEGQGFIVKYSAGDANIARQTVHLTERYLLEIQELLNSTLTLGGKFQIIIHPDKDSLNSSLGWDKSQSPMGVYWAGNISILSPHYWAAGLEQGALQAVFQKENPIAHELTHLMVDHLSKGNYPRWLSEGLAQYTEKTLTNYTLPLPEEDTGFVEIEQLETQFDNPEEQLQAYWQAREMVQFLIREYGWDKIMQYLVLLEEKDSERAFRSVYGFSSDVLPTVVYNN